MTTERPILMSAPMVRASLACTKSQTRRPLRDGTWWDPLHGVIKQAPVGLACTGFAPVPCPYGKHGDRLWVREAWRADIDFDHLPPRDIAHGAHVWYEADSGLSGLRGLTRQGKLRPGMFMPRWASRILLELAAVRVERLQDISRDDAIAEGLVAHRAAETWWGTGLEGDGFNGCRFLSPIEAYRNRWDQINGPGAWDANPFVWTLTFKRVTP